MGWAMVLNATQSAINQILERLNFLWRKQRFFIRKDFLKTPQLLVTAAAFATRPLAQMRLLRRIRVAGSTGSLLDKSRERSWTSPTGSIASIETPNGGSVPLGSLAHGDPVGCWGYSGVGSMPVIVAFTTLANLPPSSKSWTWPRYVWPLRSRAAAIMRTISGTSSSGI